MKLKVLVENNTIIDRYFSGEPGVSYLICAGDRKIIFDVGYSDLFIKNARKMGEDLMDIDFIVISHGHIDHTGGLDPLAKLYFEAKIEKLKHTAPAVIAHPEAFAYKEYEGDNIGSLLSAEKLNKIFAVTLTREPFWITDKLVFLGEIPRHNNFENKDPIGMCEKSGEMVNDFVTDDSALAYKSPNGLVIITGCSHAGICNIIEHAKKVCHENRIADVIGGFHLLDPTEKLTNGTLDYFKTLGVKTIHPSHCTSLKFKCALAGVLDVKEVGVGLSLEYQ
jgi:7,8-dihydropterin-6-yl-methyl-4-(beta-D-ribofuranosyl)aminobenzene 5'-phosphate synthase